MITFPAPPFDPARFVRAGGNEKTSLFPCADCWSWGLEPPAEWLAPARAEIARPLAGEYGGGSANHCAARLALALLFRAAGGEVTTAQERNLRHMTRRLWGADYWMVVARRRDESGSLYLNYWLAAALQSLQALISLGWDEEVVVRRWIRQSVAMMRLCYIGGKVCMAGKRTEKPYPHPSIAAALATLTSGGIAKPAIYEKLNKSRTIANRAATMARGAYEAGLWEPAAADYEDLPDLSAAPGAYHVVRGAGWLRVWCDAWLAASPGDWTHFGVEVAGGEVRWWSELDAGRKPRTEPPWGAALPGPATEYWRGGAGGWERVG